MIDFREARARGFVQVGRAWRVAPGYAVIAESLAELESARARHYAARMGSTS